MYHIEITPEMKRQFCLEAGEHLDSLEKALLVLEKDPDNREVIQSAFRAIHSVKGNSDYIGLKDINSLSHGLEDLLDGVRRGRVSLEDRTISLLFASLDLLRDINAHIQDEHYSERDVSSLVAEIGALMDKAVEGDEPAPRPRVDVTAVFQNASSQHIAFIDKITRKILSGEDVEHPEESLPRILKTFRTSANYVGASRVVAVLEQMEAAMEKARPVDRETASFLSEKLKEAARLVSEVGAAGPDRTTPPEVPLETPRDSGAAVVRVTAARVDELLDRVSELITIKNTLNHLIHTVDDSLGDLQWQSQLRDAGNAMDHLADELRHSVMKMRLAPFQSLFDRLPRIVRDLSAKSAKKAQLTLSGGDTEVDGKVMEMLVDPMIHLIRNAMDHGIESSEERVAKGKPDFGTVSVSAHQEGTQVIIDICDDGRGLDHDKIKKEAAERNLVRADALCAMTPAQIMDLVFVSGLSTSPNVTRTSGRGVGLDIVKTNLRTMGGNVTLSAEKDSGTRVKLQVPISMAIVEVLLTEVCSERYAFPFSCILETLNVFPGDIQVLNRKEVIPYRGDILSVTHLGELLGITGPGRLRQRASRVWLPVAVVAFGGQARGVVVDRIVRREGILSRPLERRLAHIREFSGAALMGDGSIVLVLDHAGFFQIVDDKRGA